MTCANCGQEIPKARRLALPGETWCVACVEASGDVERVQGAMVWNHKTGPELELGPGVPTLLRFSRRGPHASLPFNSYENPRMQASRRAQAELQDLKKVLREEPESEVEVVVDGVASIPATCHPDRPKVSPDGKCVECCVEWYARRLTR